MYLINLWKLTKPLPVGVSMLIGFIRYLKKQNKSRRAVK